MAQELQRKVRGQQTPIPYEQSDYEQMILDGMADRVLVDEAVRILYDEDACVKVDRNVQIKYDAKKGL